MTERMIKKRIFVACQRELGQLETFLHRALAGQGQICFVIGEAGRGKTTLMAEFARRAQAQHHDLVVAIGQCDAQIGVGDAYLPFREVLDLLTGDVDTKLAQGAISAENASRLQELLHASGEVLLELGPDLIDLFVPWAGLAMRVGAFAAQKVGLAKKLKRWTGHQRQREMPGREGIDQSQIFEQYINVLRALAAQQPLMLVLDDLQWADGSSIGLLFRLGRRLGQSRILVVGTYRPEEVALGRAGERHPLEKVLAEFKRYFGDIWIDLEQAEESEGRQFVDSLLDEEPNRWSEGFRQALYQHTGGHPLFTVELLQAMQERGNIIQDKQGCWVEGTELNWAVLPKRVEGVIEERFGRLEEELREALTVASVEGLDFTAEVVARVQEVKERNLIRQLSGELEKKHRLIIAQGSRRVGSHRLSRYRFRHHLFQDYLYTTLDEVERAYLHEDVGNMLEELHGERSDEIAVQLARHFAAADMPEKAQHYLRRAGEQAAARFANEEAVNHFSRALDLTPEDDLAERYALLLAREKVYDLQGARQAQLRDLAALEALAEALDDNRKQAEVALCRAHYAEATSDYSTAIAAAQAAIGLAQAAPDVHREAAGYLQWGRALWHQGDYEAARTQLEQALALAGNGRLRSVEADCLSNLGIISWYQGDYAEGRAYFEQALLFKQEINDRRGEGHVLNNLAGVSYEQGNLAQALAYQEQALRIYRQTGYRRGEGMALCNLGVFLAEQGDYAAAEAYQEQALAIYREINDREGEAAALINLGIVSLYQGDYAEGRAYQEQSLRISRETGDRRGEVEGLVYLSLLCHHLGDDEAAQRHGQEALEIAQDISDRRNRSHALTHLGHALAGLARLEEATAAYQQALALRRESGEHHRAMESLAGMARISLAQGDLILALSQVEEIMSYLETSALDGMDEPLRVYLTCYRVLRANQDGRARSILTTAYHLLQERAARISDAQMRRLFLENVTAHQELVSEWKNATARGCE